MNILHFLALIIRTIERKTIKRSKKGYLTDQYCYEFIAERKMHIKYRLLERQLTCINFGSQATTIIGIMTA